MLKDIIQSSDAQFILFVQDYLRSNILSAIMIFFSMLGTGGLLWITTAIAMVCTHKYRRAGVLLLLCLAVTWVFNDQVLKNIIQRPRPFLALPELRALVPFESSFSFPSGHTSTSFASAYIITRANGRRWVWVYAVATFIAVSRIYVGMHYPSDVFSGMLFGTFIAVMTYTLITRYVLSQKRI